MVDRYLSGVMSYSDISYCYVAYMQGLDLVWYTTSPHNLRLSSGERRIDSKKKKKRYTTRCSSAYIAGTSNAA